MNAIAFERVWDGSSRGERIVHERFWLALGSLLAAGAVMMGAYHAHGLEKNLQGRGLEPELVERRMHDAEVAVRYQFYHSLGLIVLALAARGRCTRMATVSMSLMLAGLTLFSGGLYLIVFAGTSVHWAIVPSGGLLMIVAWTVAAVAFLCNPCVETQNASTG